MDNNNQGKKKKGCLRMFLIGFGILTLLSVIGAIFGDDKKVSSDVSNNEIKDEPKQDTIFIINNLIEVIEKDKDKYKDTPNAVAMYITMFEGFSSVYNKYENSKNPEIQNRLTKLKEVAGRYQAEKLPLMRKTYTKELKDKLWRFNIDVIDKGTTIELIGGRLASNANKEDTYNGMKDIIHKLRFKRINMKWYKYDKEYTYWDLSTPKDKDLY